MSNLFAKMTNDDFRNILLRLMKEDGVEEILDIPGVFECVSEYYNNDVLDTWLNENYEEEEELEDEDDLEDCNAQ